jgi:enoyl-CoA hydratase/carnithine racemase
MPQFKAFRAQVDAGVLTVTLDDPPLNLVGPTFAEVLIALIQEAEASPAYRVVVFESAVANFFSAHLDLPRIGLKGRRHDGARMARKFIRK